METGREEVYKRVNKSQLVLYFILLISIQLALFYMLFNSEVNFYSIAFFTAIIFITPILLGYLTPKIIRFIYKKELELVEEGPEKEKPL